MTSIWQWSHECSQKLKLCPAVFQPWPYKNCCMQTASKNSVIVTNEFNFLNFWTYYIDAVAAIVTNRNTIVKMGKLQNPTSVILIWKAKPS